MQHDSHKYITTEGIEGLSTKKLNNCKLEYNIYWCSDCTKSLCLDINNKITIIKKLYVLVKTLNVNDNNEENIYGVSTDFIRNLTDLFLIIIGEIASINIPLRNIYR